MIISVSVPRNPIEQTRNRSSLLFLSHRKASEWTSFIILGPSPAQKKKKKDFMSLAVWSLKKRERLGSGWWQVWTLVMSGPWRCNWMLAGWRQVHELSDWERWPFKLAVTLTLITHDSELITVSCVNFILWSYSHLHIVHYSTTLIHFALMIVCFKYFLYHQYSICIDRLYSCG